MVALAGNDALWVDDVIVLDEAGKHAAQCAPLIAPYESIEPIAQRTLFFVRA